MNRTSWSARTLAVLLASALPLSGILPDLAHASQADAAQPELLRRLALPSSLGYITEQYLPADSKSTVVLIQDLHLHYATQKRIIKILDRLYDRQIVSGPVAVEGVQGPYDTSKIASYPAGKLKDQLTDYFLKKGELSGDEAFSILRSDGKILFGIDHGDYYRINRELFAKTRQSRHQLQAQLSSIRETLADLKKTHYSRALRRLDRERPIGMAESEQLLGRKLAAAKDPLTQNIVHTDHMLSLLTRLLSQEITLEEARYIAQRLPAFAQITEKLLAPSHPSSPAATGGGSIEEVLRSAVDYYILALMRDEPMAKNTMQLLDRRNQTQISNPTVQNLNSNVLGLRFEVREQRALALVAGGFHTAGLTREFMKAGVGYVVITPHIAKLPTPAERELYEQRLAGTNLNLSEVASDFRLIRHSPIQAVMARANLLYLANLWQTAWRGAQGFGGGRVPKQKGPVLFEINDGMLNVVISQETKTLNPNFARIEQLLRSSYERFLQSRRQTTTGPIFPTGRLRIRGVQASGEEAPAYRQDNEIGIDLTLLDFLASAEGKEPPDPEAIVRQLIIDQIFHHELLHSGTSKTTRWLIATVSTLVGVAALTIAQAVSDFPMSAIWPFWALTFSMLLGPIRAAVVAFDQEVALLSNQVDQIRYNRHLFPYRLKPELKRLLEGSRSSSVHRAGKLLVELVDIAILYQYSSYPVWRPLVEDIARRAGRANLFDGAGTLPTPRDASAPMDSAALESMLRTTPNASDSQIREAVEAVQDAFRLSQSLVIDPGDRALVDRAFRLAMRVHAGQPRARGDSRPYAIHVAGVVKLLIDEFKVADHLKGRELANGLAMAWLHDALEDGHKGIWGKAQMATPGQNSETVRSALASTIESEFGSDVLDLVQSLSKPAYDGDSLDEEIRIEATYYEQLATRPLASQLGKAADFAYNLGDLINHPDRTFPKKFFAKRLLPVLRFLEVAKFNRAAKASLLRRIDDSVHDNTALNARQRDPVNAPSVLNDEQAAALQQAKVELRILLSQRGSLKIGPTAAKTTPSTASGQTAAPQEPKWIVVDSRVYMGDSNMVPVTRLLKRLEFEFPGLLIKIMDVDGLSDCPQGSLWITDWSGEKRLPAVVRAGLHPYVVRPSANTDRDDTWDPDRIIREIRELFPSSRREEVQSKGVQALAWALGLYFTIQGLLANTIAEKTVVRGISRGDWFFIGICVILMSTLLVALATSLIGNFKSAYIWWRNERATTRRALISTGIEITKDGIKALQISGNDSLAEAFSPRVADSMRNLIKDFLMGHNIRLQRSLWNPFVQRVEIVVSRTTQGSYVSPGFSTVRVVLDGPELAAFLKVMQDDSAKDSIARRYNTDAVTVERTARWLALQALEEEICEHTAAPTARPFLALSLATGLVLGILHTMGEPIAIGWWFALGASALLSLLRLALDIGEERQAINFALFRLHNRADRPTNELVMWSVLENAIQSSPTTGSRYDLISVLNNYDPLAAISVLLRRALPPLLLKGRRTMPIPADHSPAFGDDRPPQKWKFKPVTLVENGKNTEVHIPRHIGGMQDIAGWLANNGHHLPKGHRWIGTTRTRVTGESIIEFFVEKIIPDLPTYDELLKRILNHPPSPLPSGYVLVIDQAAGLSDPILRENIATLKALVLANQVRVFVKPTEEVLTTLRTNTNSQPVLLTANPKLITAVKTEFANAPIIAVGPAANKRWSGRVIRTPDLNTKAQLLLNQMLRDARRPTSPKLLTMKAWSWITIGALAAAAYNLQAKTPGHAPAVSPDVLLPLALFGVTIFVIILRFFPHIRRFIRELFSSAAKTEAIRTVPTKTPESGAPASANAPAATYADPVAESIDAALGAISPPQPPAPAAAPASQTDGNIQSRRVELKENIVVVFDSIVAQKGRPIVEYLIWIDPVASSSAAEALSLFGHPQEASAVALLLARNEEADTSIPLALLRFPGELPEKPGDLALDAQIECIVIGKTTEEEVEAELRWVGWTNTRFVRLPQGTSINPVLRQPPLLPGRGSIAYLEIKSPTPAAIDPLVIHGTADAIEVSPGAVEAALNEPYTRISVARQNPDWAKLATIMFEAFGLSPISSAQTLGMASNEVGQTQRGSLKFGRLSDEIPPSKVIVAIDADAIGANRSLVNQLIKDVKAQLPDVTVGIRHIHGLNKSADETGIWITNAAGAQKAQTVSQAGFSLIVVGLSATETPNGNAARSWSPKDILPRIRASIAHEPIRTLANGENPAGASPSGVFTSPAFPGDPATHAHARNLNPDDLLRWASLRYHWQQPGASRADSSPIDLSLQIDNRGNIVLEDLLNQRFAAYHERAEERTELLRRRGLLCDWFGLLNWKNRDNPSIVLFRKHVLPVIQQRIAQHKIETGMDMAVVVSEDPELLGSQIPMVEVFRNGRQILVLNSAWVNERISILRRMPPVYIAPVLELGEVLADGVSHPFAAPMGNNEWIAEEARVATEAAFRHFDVMFVGDPTDEKLSPYGLAMTDFYKQHLPASVRSGWKLDPRKGLFVKTRKAAVSGHGVFSFDAFRKSLLDFVSAHFAIPGRGDRMWTMPAAPAFSQTPGDFDRLVIHGGLITPPAIPALAGLLHRLDEAHGQPVGLEITHFTPNGWASAETLATLLHRPVAVNANDAKPTLTPRTLVVDFSDPESSMPAIKHPGAGKSIFVNPNENPIQNLGIVQQTLNSSVASKSIVFGWGNRMFEFDWGGENAETTRLAAVDGVRRETLDAYFGLSPEQSRAPHSYAVVFDVNAEGAKSPLGLVKLPTPLAALENKPLPAGSVFPVVRLTSEQDSALDPRLSGLGENVTSFSPLLLRLELNSSSGQTSSALVLTRTIEKVGVVGMPGAGKDTHVYNLGQALGNPVITTTDLMKAAIASGEAPELQAIRDSGAQVSDAQVIELVQRELNKPAYAFGYVLSGAPRSVGQLKAFIDGGQLDVVIWLNIVPDIYRQRAAQRRQTAITMGETPRRDDAPEQVEARIVTYNQHTAPVLEALRRQYPEKLIEVDASLAGAPKVFNESLMPAVTQWMEKNLHPLVQRTRSAGASSSVYALAAGLVAGSALNAQTLGNSSSVSPDVLVPLVAMGLGILGIRLVIGKIAAWWAAKEMRNTMREALEAKLRDIDFSKLPQKIGRSLPWAIPSMVAIGLLVTAPKNAQTDYAQAALFLGAA